MRDKPEHDAKDGALRGTHVNKFLMAISVSTLGGTVDIRKLVVGENPGQSREV